MTNMFLKGFWSSSHISKPGKSSILRTCWKSSNSAFTGCCAAHSLLSAAIRTWHHTQFVTPRSTDMCTEHRCRVQWGTLPTHSSWNWSEQHVGALLAYSQEQNELGILKGEEGPMISLEGDSRGHWGLSLKEGQAHFHTYPFILTRTDLKLTKPLFTYHTFNIKPLKHCYSPFRNREQWSHTGALPFHNPLHRTQHPSAWFHAVVPSLCADSCWGNHCHCPADHSCWHFSPSAPGWGSVLLPGPADPKATAHRTRFQVCASQATKILVVPWPEHRQLKWNLNCPWRAVL